KVYPPTSRHSPCSKWGVFNVSAKERDRAIEEAEAFLADSLPVLQEVERLQKRQPTSRVLDPSEGIKALHSELREAQRQAFFLGQKIVTLRGRIKIAIGESLGIRGIASWKWREQWRLDLDALRREEPKVYEKFKCLSGYREFHLE